MRTPEEMEKYLDKDQLKLYRLIWSRFVASQMTPAISGYNESDATAEWRHIHRLTDPKSNLKDSCKCMLRDEMTAKKTKRIFLPELNEGDVVQSISIEPKQHFTQPPARFSEATLIKTLEEKMV